MILEPKGKARVCATPLSYYDRIISVGRKPIYMRYDAVRSFLSPHLPPQELLSLAEPVYDEVDDTLLWFASPASHDSPVPLTELSPAQGRNEYASQKESFTARLREVSGKLGEEERRIVEGVLKTFRDEYVLCYDGKIAIVAWGMYPTKDLYNPAGLICVRTGPTVELTFDYGEHGQPQIPTDRVRKFRKGAKITRADLPAVVVQPGYHFCGWTPAFDSLILEKNMLLTAQYDHTRAESSPVAPPPLPPSEDCTVRFATDGHAGLSSERSIRIRIGESISPDQMPEVFPDEGWVFAGWSPDPAFPIMGDCTFTALTKREQLHRCTFDLGGYGETTAATSFTVPHGWILQPDQIPIVQGILGSRFRGWEPDPVGYCVEEDTTFRALYDHVVWYRRIWTPLHSAWRWLRWLLLFLLLLLLLLLLFGWLSRQCTSCSSTSERHAPIGQVDTIRTGDGHRRDDNGARTPGGDAPDIIGDDGKMPVHPVVPPVVGSDGALPPIVSQPDEPDVVGNRLNIYFEDSNPDLDAFARDFRRLYPSPKYKIIGVDRAVPWVQIQIPESERGAIRERLPSQLKQHGIFVVDETLIRGSSIPVDSTFFRTQAVSGWHLDAVQARKAWSITKGSPSVRIAVVDDGLELNHPMFANQAGIEAYNVFTKGGKISVGDGHGTHVAGIALGGHAGVAKGAAGIAPECQLMVVQVGDNGRIPTSALVSGVMYALNHGADVVNVSIGDTQDWMQKLSEEEQRHMARTRYKNEERIWSRVYEISKQRNAILVFSAGNERVLAYISPLLRSNQTINVSATAPNGKLTSFSNYGTGTHIAAPGASIYSAVPKQRYEEMDGTSMAAPIVTGAVALMRSLDSTLDVERTMTILRATAKKTNHSESPLLQIADALRMVQRGDYARPAPGTPNPGRPDSEPGRDLPGRGAPSAPSPGTDPRLSPPIGGERRGSDGTPIPVPPGQQRPGLDRDSILRLIREYQRRIEILRRQLDETPR